MKKVAKLITVVLKTWVVVNENATEEEILEKSKLQFIDKIINNELSENLEAIEDDLE